MSILARQSVDCANAIRFISGTGGTDLAGKGVGLPLITAGSPSGSFYAIACRTLSTEASKFCGVTFNLTSGLSGTGLTGVWEYATGTSPNGTATWTALSNVVDDTNGLTSSGTNTVTWEVPADWNNYGAVYSGALTYYPYAVRYRITGGTISGAGSSAAIPLCIMHGIKCSAEASLTFGAILSADAAGTTSHRSRAGVTATDANPLTNRYFLSLAGRSCVGGSANDAAIITTNFSGFTSVTVRVAGLDGAGAAQTEDVVITGNGTSNLTKTWTSLTTTQVTSVTGTGSFDYELRTNRWGFVSQPNSDGYTFIFYGDLTLTGTTNISSITGETILFKRNNRMIHISGANTYGVEATPLHATKIPTFIFEQHNADGHNISAMYGGTVYGVNVYFLRMAGASGSQGGWNTSYSTTLILSNSTLSGFRNVGHTNTRNYRNRSLDAHWEASGGVFAECSSLGSGHQANAGMRINPNSSSYNGSPIGHALDLTGLASSISYDINIYNPNSFADNFLMQTVDFLHRKSATDGNRFSWFFLTGWSKTGNVVQELFSSEIYVFDSDNNALSGVKLDVRRSDDSTLVIALESNANGFMSALGGTATSGTTTRLTDTSKSLSFNQYKRYELKITGGTGAGQRRYLGDTGSNYFDVHPYFSTAPSTDSIYALIPYFHCRTWSPASTPASGTVTSTVVDHGPFFSRFRKYGYKTIKAVIPFDQKSFLQYTLIADSVISEASEATAAAYTGIDVDHDLETVTLTEDHTINELYDYIHADILSNMGNDDPIESADGISFTMSYSIVIDGCVLSGLGKSINFGSNTVTFSDGGTSNATLITDSATYTNVIVSGLLEDTRVQVYDGGTSTELYNDIVPDGTLTLPVVWTADTGIRVRAQNVVTVPPGAFPSATKWFESTGTLRQTGLEVAVVPEADTIYNNILIDGSTVTECSIVDDTLLINVDDPDNVTTLQRIYAFEVYWLSTEDGIRDQELYVYAPDETHFEFQGGLQIKNLSSLPLTITGGNVYPSSGPAADVLDTSGGPIFVNSHEVVPLRGLADIVYANVTQINDDAVSAANLQRSTAAVVRGTVGAGSSISALITSSLSPAAAVENQFMGRVVTFDKDTATASLRGQAAAIVGSTASGRLDISALTTVPAAGDTFVIT